MCIIVYKPYGIPVPSLETMRTCWNKNSDGAGLMYPTVDKKLTITKGFMTWEDFAKAYASLRQENTFVAHFRIRTHGKSDPDNTHPFWIKENEVGLAHNGILPISRLIDSDATRSDTSTICAEVLSKLPDRWWENEHFAHLIEEYMGAGNKMVVMDKEGKTTILNRKAGTEEGGCWYSNTGFRTFTSYSYDDSGYDHRSHGRYDGTYRGYPTHRTHVGTTHGGAATGAGSTNGRVEAEDTKDSSGADRRAMTRRERRQARKAAAESAIVDAEKTESDPDILDICRAIEDEFAQEDMPNPSPGTTAFAAANRARANAIGEVWALQRSKLLTLREAQQLTADVRNGRISPHVMILIVKDMRDGIEPATTYADMVGALDDANEARDESDPEVLTFPEVGDVELDDTQAADEAGKEETVRIERPDPTKTLGEIVAASVAANEADKVARALNALTAKPKA